MVIVSDLPRRAFTRTAKLATLPVGLAGRTALGLGKRLGGRPAELVATEIQQRTAEQIFRVLGELKGGADSWSLVSVARYGPASSGGSAASKMDSAWPNFIAPPLSSPRTRKICSAVRCWISVATSSAGRPPRRFPRPSAVRPASPTGRVASLAVRVKARRGRSLTIPLSVSRQDGCHHPSWVIQLRPLYAAGPRRGAGALGRDPWRPHQATCRGQSVNANS